MKKMPFDPTKWCDYQKCIVHDRFNFFALLRMQKCQPDQQTSNPNFEQEIYQDPFPNHVDDKKGKAKAKEKNKKKSKSKCSSSSSSSDEEEESNLSKSNRKIPHYKQVTDGSNIPPDNSVEASSSKNLEAEGAKKGAKLISLIKTFSQKLEDILITTCSQAQKEATHASQPSIPLPVVEVPIPGSEPILDKPIPNRLVRVNFQ